MNLANKIMDFLEKVDFKGQLPEGIKILNPYRDNPTILSVCKVFYEKYYNDNHPRKLILGINPGRLGAGATGIPFTDTKRLNDICEIPYSEHYSHEPSSDFIYRVIDAYGGPNKFYQDFYFSSVCPLGFVKIDNMSSKAINYNYYDDNKLYLYVEDFILNNLYLQKKISQVQSSIFCLGSGKNLKYLNRLNNTYSIFENIIPLEHPRYIMQYKAKNIDYFVEDYINKLNNS